MSKYRTQQHTLRESSYNILFKEFLIISLFLPASVTSFHINGEAYVANAWAPCVALGPKLNLAMSECLGF